MSKHILEALAATNPDCEIWWDSSPLVYEGWAKTTVESAPPGKRKAWAEQLKRMMDRDELARTGKMGFRGVTTNPPLSLQAIEADPKFWRQRIQEIEQEERGLYVELLFWRTYLDIVRRGAAMVHPVWRASGGRYGFLSGQVDPRFVTDGEKMLAQGLEISSIAPNVMVKIPGSKEGYEVIEQLTARGISTNNTTAFTVPQYVACMQAVSRGLTRAKRAGVDLSTWRSVITHMSARLGNLGDLKTQANARGIDLSPEDILWAETAVMKRAYRYGRSNGHPSKMLQCSMRVTRNPDGTASSWHIEKLAGGDFVYTCPPGYIRQLMEGEDGFAPFDAHAIDEDVPAPVIEKLLRIPYFRQAYEFDGMRPEEFVGFGAFATTAAEFAAATRKTVDFVAQVHDGAGSARAA